MNVLHPTTLPACFVFTVATQILNLKWISKFWHFSSHGVCYWMILCWLESAGFRLFYWLRKASTFSIVVSWLPFKRFLVLIDYSKGTDWKQLLLLEMSECFSRWAALVVPWVPETFLARFPMCWPSANTENSRRTREKPLVPRVP